MDKVLVYSYIYYVHNTNMLYIKLDQQKTSITESVIFIFSTKHVLNCSYFEKLYFNTEPVFIHIFKKVCT